MTKVIGIGERGGKKLSEMSKVEVCLRLAQTVDKSPGGLPCFYPTYHAAKVDEGIRIVLRVVDGDTVMVSSREAVAQDLLKFSRELKNKNFLIDWKGALGAADVWLNGGSPLELPPPFLWADQPGLTFNRLPWTSNLDGATPTWDGLLSRLSNADAFKAWIGSLFITEADHQQYVWCYSEGGQGKGAIDRFLQRVMGRAYRSEEPPQAGDKFWTYFLIGARLVAFPDCNAKGFPASGKFKSLCANDAVRCEVKGGRSFHTRLGCRFIFFSNELPTLSTEAADMRRVIYCEFEKQAEGFTHDPGFEKRLWDEGGSFLGKCIRAYTLGNPTHGPLKTCGEDIESWAAVQDIHLESIFDENFMLDPNGFVTATKMNEIVQGWAKGRERQGFYEYIKKNKGLSYKKKRVDGRAVWVYPGVRFVPRTRVLQEHY